MGPPPSHDVAVVGAGPVGAALAVLLGRLGRSVVVLERRPVPYRLPRAVHIDQQVARILQACGLGDDLEAITEPADIYEWRNAEGRTLLRMGRAGVGSCGWPHSLMFHQPTLEDRLDRRLAGLAGLAEPGRVELRRDAEVTDLRQEDDGVTLTVSTAGAPTTVRTRWAVGCDGANSTVRRLLGVGEVDLGFFYDWLIVDVVLHQPRVFDPINLQICDPARPVTVVSGGPGRRRWEFMRLPGETVDQLNDEAAAWRLLAPFDAHPGNATLERHTVYTFQARRVEEWRAGRVLLAGDAAHQMPPFAGQGLCAGLRDAHNLGWKLDLVLDGRAGDGLIDSYQLERAPHVATVTDLSVELGKVICVPDPAAAAVRDAAMLDAAAGQGTIPPPELPGFDEGLRDAGSPRAGELFLQATVVVDGQRRRFDDAVGAGWRLVAPAGRAPTVDEELARWFAGIGGRVVVVGSGGAEGDGGDVEDPDGAYDAWFAHHGVAAALQRPDFHLYGTAVDEPGAVELLRRLRAALAR